MDELDRATVTKVELRAERGHEDEPAPDSRAWEWTTPHARLSPAP